jgi:hypothetical protein
LVGSNVPFCPSLVEKIEEIIMKLNIFSRDASLPLERTTTLFAGVATAVLASIASAPSHAPRGGNLR